MYFRRFSYFQHPFHQCQYKNIKILWGKKINEKGLTNKICFVHWKMTNLQIIKDRIKEISFQGKLILSKPGMGFSGQIDISSTLL